jgi:predicted nucleic acid-binding protein
MNVLVDTSVWSLALRRKAGHLNAAEKLLVLELRELISEGRVRLLGVVRQELLSGIKTNTQFEKLRMVLRAYPDEPVSTSDHEDAAKAGNDCRTGGMAATVVDILLCAIAIKRNWPIFTTDPDFRNYAKVLPLKLHVPRERAPGGE